MSAKAPANRIANYECMCPLTLGIKQVLAGGCYFYIKKGLKDI